jgi:PEP-CTERM motif
MHLNLKPSRAFPALAAAATFLFTLTPAASAVKINFTDQPASGFPIFTSDTKKGFTVTPIAGQFVVGDSFGDPAPDLAVIQKSATISITYSGGDFTFTSVDLAGLHGTYSITGLLDGSTVFTVSDKITGDDVFKAYKPDFSSDLIDQLEITLTDKNNEADLDNIVVKPAADPDPVPEPSSFLLLGSGLVATAGALRRSLATR